MKMKSLLCLFLFLSFAIPLSAEEVSLTVKAGKIRHRIDEKIYGHFLENIYNSCNNGLWGDLVWNRSFDYNNAGLWELEEDGTLVQKSVVPEQIRLLGNDDLKDYVFTVEAMKTGGSEGFLIPFHYRSEKEFHWVNLGGWSNERHGIERKLERDSRQVMIGASMEGSIEKNKWYEISVRCEGKKTTVKLNGKTILENEDPANLDSGNVGVGTWNTQAKFRNYKIVNLDGTEVKAEFKSVTQMPHYWKIYGNAIAELDSKDPLNDNWSLKISGEKTCGVFQDKYCFKKGETYAGSIWVCSETNGGLKVAVPGISENILKRTGNMRTKKVGSNLWTEIPMEFTADRDQENGSLRIGFTDGGAVQIDQVSLMPKSWKENYDGMRPDLLGAIDALKPPVIRWPGGCYASIYRWKDGIGPQENRKSEHQVMWDDKDVNSFGTDEFMKLCRRVGAEPILVVNLASQNWYPEGTDRSEFIQDVLDWIEYCNGPADSKWGKIRAENGHTEPYNVKYWELDNETWGWGVRKYADAVNEIAPIIRKQYPELKLFACGSADYGDHPTGFPWNKYIIDNCAENFDYLSIHHYKDPNAFDNGPREYEAFIARHRDLIAGSKNPKIKIYCSEWNAQSTDWRTGLYCGGILNGFERLGDIFEIGGPALFLRHVTAKAWDNAFINFDNNTWFPGPNYVVMKLYRENYQPNMLELEGDWKGTNCIASKSDDGKKIVLKFVNPSRESKEMIVKIDGFQAKTGSLKIVKGENLRDRNTLSEPGKIVPQDAKLNLNGNTVRFTLPPYSIGVAGIEM